MRRGASRVTTVDSPPPPPSLAKVCMCARLSMTVPVWVWVCSHQLRVADEIALLLRVMGGTDTQGTSLCTTGLVDTEGPCMNSAAVVMVPQKGS